MVQINSNGPGPSGRLTIYTYTCSFCNKDFQTDTNYDRARDHCCGDNECKLQRDRIRKAEEYQVTKAKEDATVRSWDERVGSFGPGEEVGTFKAKLTGSRFTASGGVILSLLVPPEFKRAVFDVTDYSGMMMHIVIRRPEDS